MLVGIRINIKMRWLSLFLSTSIFSVARGLPGYFCWVGGVSEEDCCDTSFGPSGNPACWDGGFTHERCCDPYVLQLENTWGPKLLQTLNAASLEKVEGRENNSFDAAYDEMEQSLRTSLYQVENRTMSAHSSAIFLLLLLRLKQRFQEAETILAQLYSADSDSVDSSSEYALQNLAINEKTGVWSGKSSIGFHMHDVALVEKGLLPLLFKYNAKTVLDLGCGVGYYVRDFRRVNLQAFGVDGNPDTVAISDGRCTVANLAEKLDLGLIDLGLQFDRWCTILGKAQETTYLGTQFDVVLSLEVAEHVPPEFEKTFVSNLVRHAGNLLILSWGNQPGHGHVNNKNSAEVVKLLTAGGIGIVENGSDHAGRENGSNSVFEYDGGESVLLRKKASFGWFKETLHVFRRKRKFGFDSVAPEMAAAGVE